MTDESPPITVVFNYASSREEKADDVSLRLVVTSGSRREAGFTEVSEVVRGMVSAVHGECDYEIERNPPLLRIFPYKPGHTQQIELVQLYSMLISFKNQLERTGFQAVLSID